jgi:hypothetical protein
VLIGGSDVANLRPKIRKLILALSQRGEKYTIDQRQFWSDKAQKVCTIKVLSKIVYSDEKDRYVKKEVASYYNDVDIVLKLAEIYLGKAGVSSG